MSEFKLELEATDFIAPCRALSAASRGTKRAVRLRFTPGELLIEGEMGGGVVRTTGTFSSEARVPYGMLSKVASLHRKSAQSSPWIHCTVDVSLKELRFPYGRLKARFENRLRLGKRAVRKEEQRHHRQ
jgi:hypothetical protein